MSKLTKHNKLKERNKKAEYDELQKEFDRLEEELDKVAHDVEEDNIYIAECGENPDEMYNSEFGEKLQAKEARVDEIYEEITRIHDEMNRMEDEST